MKYVHASGPFDIGCDFEAVDELVLSNLTRSSFQYTESFNLIHDFSIFFDKWLTVDTVQLYQCWVSRSIGISGRCGGPISKVLEQNPTCF
jgi:hypothetical protein